MQRAENLINLLRVTVVTSRQSQIWSEGVNERLLGMDECSSFDHFLKAKTTVDVEGKIYCNTEQDDQLWSWPVAAKNRTTHTYLHKTREFAYQAGENTNTIMVNAGTGISISRLQDHWIGHFRVWKTWTWSRMSSKNENSKMSSEPEETETALHHREGQGSRSQTH